jgi:DNA-binding Xre family transcriptional regulator
MPNLSIIRDICKEKRISLRELSNEIGITENGLQLIMKSNNAKFDIIEKIAKVLKVNILAFVDFELLEYDFKQQFQFDIPSYLILDEKITFLAKRYSRFSEIIELYKDYYLFCIVRAIKEGFEPEYKCVNKEFSGKVIMNDQYLATITRIDDEVGLDRVPFCKLNAIHKDKITNTLVFDGFYFPIFDINFKNINDYLEDGLINETEILEYWKAWKSK